MKLNISPKMLFCEFQRNFPHRRHTGWIDFEEIQKNEYIYRISCMFYLLHLSLRYWLLLFHPKCLQLEEIKNHTFIIDSYLFYKPPDPTLTLLCDGDKNCYI